MKKGDEHTVFLDGQVIFQKDVSHNIGQNGTVFLGAALSYHSLQDPLKGGIDEVALYDRALAADEVQSLYELGSRGQSLRP